MKSNFFLRKNHGFFSILLIILVGCGFQDQSPTVMVPETEVVIKRQTITETSAVTITKTFQPTRTPTFEPSPTPLPTWTPIPTLNTQDAHDYVNKLMETNGECEFLPCWWGIIPGKTTWMEADQFLSSFMTDINTLRNDLYGVTFEENKDKPRLVAYAIIKVDKNIVQTIKSILIIPFSDFLDLNGKPTEVWLRVDPESINEKAPFVIALYYQKGFIVSYEGTLDKAEHLIVCPNEITTDLIATLLWDPLLGLTFQQAGGQILQFSNLPKQRFYKLEEVTDLNTKDFYEKYRIAENGSSCFEMKYP